MGAYRIGPKGFLPRRPTLAKAQAGLAAAWARLWQPAQHHPANTAIGGRHPGPMRQQQWLLYLGSLAAGLLAWDFVARSFSTFILAPPSLVAVRLGEGIASLQLPRLLAQSLGHMMLGFVLAAIVAVPLGLLMGRSKAMHDMLEPIVNAIFAIPIVAFTPFIIIWFGLYFEARVALVFLMCVFDMLLIVAAGARDVDRNLLDVSRSFAAGPWQRMRLVLLPASLPFLFTAMRIGLVRAVNGMITAELFLAAVGLGAYMKAASNRFDSAAVLAVIVILCLTGLALQESVKWLEARLLPWHVRR
jgi:NitT/TauT family transport system permease protein